MALRRCSYSGCPGPPKTSKYADKLYPHKPSSSVLSDKRILTRSLKQRSTSFAGANHHRAIPEKSLLSTMAILIISGIISLSMVSINNSSTLVDSVASQLYKVLDLQSQIKPREAEHHPTCIATQGVSASSWDHPTQKTSGPIILSHPSPQPIPATKINCHLESPYWHRHLVACDDRQNNLLTIDDSKLILFDRATAESSHDSPSKHPAQLLLRPQPIPTNCDLESPCWHRHLVACDDRQNNLLTIDDSKLFPFDRATAESSHDSPSKHPGPQLISLPPPILATQPNCHLESPHWRRHLAACDDRQNNSLTIDDSKLIPFDRATAESGHDSPSTHPGPEDQPSVSTSPPRSPATTSELLQPKTFHRPLPPPHDTLPCIIAGEFAAEDNWGATARSVRSHRDSSLKPFQRLFDREHRKHQGSNSEGSDGFMLRPQTPSRSSQTDGSKTPITLTEVHRSNRRQSLKSTQFIETAKKNTDDGDLLAAVQSALYEARQTGSRKTTTARVNQKTPTPPPPTAFHLNLPHSGLPE